MKFSDRIIMAAIGLTMAAILIVSAGRLNRIVNPPAGVFADYTEQGLIGTRPAGGHTVTRQLVDGYPAVRSGSNPVVHTVRCGPLRTVPVESFRSWEILEPVTGAVVDAGPGESREADLTPLLGVTDVDLDPGSECHAVTFDSVPIPAEYIARADGRPLRFSLRIEAEGFEPARLVTEWFVVVGSVPVEAPTAQLALYVQQHSPTRLTR